MHTLLEQVHGFDAYSCISIWIQLVKAHCHQLALAGDKPKPEHIK
jgi:hypothetical protein